jgi:ribosomal protein S18 acetylase RimI-like enzyme
MPERIFRKLAIPDLQMLVNTRKEADALAINLIDEESARLFLSNPMNYFFACIEDNRIIGYAYGYELNRIDNAGNMLYIHAVGVHSGYRRQGVGKQMINAVKQLCKLSGICKFFLDAHKNNTAACALYDSTGGVAHRDDNVSYFFNKFD